MQRIIARCFAILLAALFIQILLMLPVTIRSAYSQDLDPANDGKSYVHPKNMISWSGVQATQETNGKVKVGIRLVTKGGFAIYKEKMQIQGPDSFSVRITSSPAAAIQEDPLNGEPVEVYYGGDFELEILGPRRASATSIPLSITYTGCTKKICLFPYTEKLSLPIYLEYGEEASSAQEVDLPNVLQERPRASLNLEMAYAERLRNGDLPLSLILILVFLGGIATNLTPCVFPMIPITLRLLSQREGTKFLVLLLYASGIVVSYCVIGMIAVISGGVFGSWMANQWFNVVFAIVFAILGLTMLGFGNLSQLQAIGSRFGSSQSIGLRSFGMGAGAGLVAAPCTGPIMAGLLAYSTSTGSTSTSLGLFFVYSVGFALPYLILGLASNRIRVLKVNPRVQVAVKIVFSAMLFGLSFYYLRIPLKAYLMPMKGFWSSASIALLACSLLSLVLIMRRVSLMINKKIIFVPALLMGISLFSGIQFIFGGDVSSSLLWHTNEQEAYQASVEQGKPLLVDGWAEWCPACKKMDITTFADSEVISLLQKDWTVLKLDLTQQNESDAELAKKYRMQGLPTIVLVPANGDMKKSVSYSGYVSKEELIQALHSFKRN